MTYRRALVGRWSRRDRLAVLVVATIVALLVGSALVVLTAGGETTRLAADINASGTVTLYDDPDTARAAAGPETLVAPLARVTVRDRPVTVLGVPADAGNGSGFEAPIPPDHAVLGLSTATDDAVLNDAAQTAARERGILVNRADEHGERDPGSVVVPATVRDDPVTVAVATGGKSPALSRYLREEIESEFAGAGEMADLTGELREELQDRGVPAETRRDAVRAVVRSSAVWKALDTGSSKPRQVAVDVIEDVTGETL